MYDLKKIENKMHDNKHHALLNFRKLKTDPNLLSMIASI